MSLIETAVRKPVTTTMFFVAVVMLGVVSLARLPVDFLPDIAYPRLTIRTSYPDTPPVEVEQLLTLPIAQVVATIARVRKVSSVSKEGVSLVTLHFLWGTDIDIAALHVREKLDNLRWSLPRAAGRPTILRLDPRTQPVISLAVTGGDLVRLKELTRNVIKRRLEQLDGVALARVTGGLEREIQVEVDNRKMTALGISIDQVGTALARANRSLPGGTIKKGRYRYALRTLAEFQEVSELAQVVVAGSGTGPPVLLQEIAVVKDGFREREAITRYNGQEAIGVLLTKEAGANSVAVSRAVRAVLAELESEFPEVHIAIASDEAEFISESLASVVQAVILGGILSFFVLFFFLRDFRHPLAIAVAIPIAILAAFALMFFTGVTVNMVSLGGLALGVGMLVDNSIVVLENIFRHRQEGAATDAAAVQAAQEVAMPVLASTLTTICVFFPIIYVTGVAGELFRDQSLTVTYSLLASFVVSLTLLPMLAARLLRRRPANAPGTQPAGSSPDPAAKQGGRLMSALSTIKKGLSVPFDKFETVYQAFAARYERILEWSLQHRGRVLAGALTVLALSLALGLTLDRHLVPGLEHKEFFVEVTLPPGSSLQATSEVASEVEQVLSHRPEVAAVLSQLGLAAGQAALLAPTSDFNRARLHVRLHDHVAGHAGRVVAALRKRLVTIPGAEISIELSSSLLSRVLVSGQADLVVKIIGNDSGQAKRLLREVKDRISQVEGLTNFRTTYQEGRPEIRLALDREAVARGGLTSQQVVAFIRNQMSGAVATHFHDFDRKIEVRVRPQVAARDELNDLLNSYVHAGQSAIPLRQLVHPAAGQGPVEIRRENQVRQVVLLANVEGRSFRAVLQEVERRLQTVERPFDFRIEVGGEREEMERSFRSLAFVFVLSLALVYMVLAGQFESLRHPFVIMFAVPLALIGAVLALFVTGQSLNVMSLIGMVVLIGIVVNDAIIKVDFINQERKRGVQLAQAIASAGRKRLRPILMTTVTTVLGLLPMALGFGSGAELRQPLAIAVIGGLLSATLLTLVVVPVMYAVVERTGQSGD